MSLFRRRRAPTEETPAADEQQRLIATALERLGDMTVREVMTPRVDLVALQAPVTIEDVTRAVRETGHSRFPVYDESLDRLVGVLFVKDLFRMDDMSPEAIARRIRKPFLVPEGRRVLEALQDFRQRRTGFGVVVDEYGGVEGVLTAKDLLSELVGELPDEHDRHDEEEIVRIDAQRWLVDGACPVDRVRDELGADVPDGEYVTMGGFLFDRFGRIPEEGDCVEWEGWEFRVAEMERRRIAKIVVRAPSGTMTEPAGNGG